MRAVERKRQKQTEAEERHASYVPNPQRFGLKQNVKAGLLHPDEVNPYKYHAKAIEWCRGTGYKRFEKVNRAKEKALKSRKGKKKEKSK